MIDFSAIPAPESVKPALLVAGPIVEKLIIAIVLFMIGKMVAGWVQSIVKTLLRKAKVDEALTGFLSSLARYAVLAATIIAVLDQVGIQTTSLLAVFASAGLAIGLALQGSLSNFAAGTMILGFRPFKIGDVINAGGVSGCVEDIGLFTTTLLTLDNEVIIVPNSGITGGNIQNFTSKDFRRVSTDIGIAYGEDVHKAEKVLLAAASKNSLRRPEPEPNVFLTGFGASSIDFNVRVYVDNANYWGAINELRKQVYDDLNEAGIEIPFNQIVVHQAPTPE